MIKAPKPRLRGGPKKFCVILLAIGFLWMIGGEITAQGLSNGLTNHTFGYVGGALKFQHLNYEQGLSNNNVWSVWQDSLGFMWFGTVGGLNRFDGYSVRSFKEIPGDKKSLSANLITVVYEDQSGDFWVGTWEDGLNHIDRETEAITRYQFDMFDPNSIGSDSVRTILQDSQGVLWVGTAGGGLNRYDPETDTFVRYLHDKDAPNSLGSNDVFSLLEDSAGNLWIGTFAGGLNRYIRGKDCFRQYYTEIDADPGLRGSLIHTMAEDQDGNLWLGTWGSGLFRYELRRDQLKEFRHDPDNPASLSNDFVLSLAVDHVGALWVGTDGGGLNMLQRDGETFEQYTHHPGDDYSLSNNVVRSLFVDHEGTLWIGTWGGGVDRLSYEYNQFNHFRYIPKTDSGLSDNNVLALFQDEDGIVWAGTKGGGLNRVDLSTGEVRVFSQDKADPAAISSNSVARIAPGPEGELWIGTLGGGLNRFDTETEEFTRVEFPENLGCYDVYALASTEKQLWVGCSAGLVGIPFAEGAAVVFTSNPGDSESLSNAFITDLVLHKQEVLWIGTYGGLNRLDLKTGNIRSYQHDRDDPSSLSDNSITTLYEDSWGRLWVGTLGGGLNEFDRDTETFTNYFEYEGQFGDAVLGITEGSNTKPGEGLELWLSTYEGLVRFSPEAGVLRVYDTADGLQGNTFNPNAVYGNEQGELLFGGTNGFNIFSPDQLIRNQEAPNVVITEFSLDMKPVAVGEGSALSVSITETETIFLTYEDRVLSFEFSALSFAAPEKNRYRYMLENFEDDWHEVASDRRFVTFTNLDPGEYVFRVVGSNADGVWNETGTSLQIVISPPWWDTWWFLAAAVVSGVALVFGGIRLRLGYLEQQRKRLGELVSERTQEIVESSQKLAALNQELEAFAYSVSHDLRAPLRAMNGYNSILLEEYSEALDEDGKEFVQRSLKAVGRMNTMIDAVLELSRMTRQDIEKNRLNLSELAARLAEEISETDHERRVEWRIQPGIEVVGDRRVLMVVLENLMGNAWKFSCKREEAVIEVGEVIMDGSQVLFVRDNGIGFNPRHAGEVFSLFQRLHSFEDFEGYGVGLAVVRRAVLKHGGNIWFESEVGKGATFFFTL